MKNQNICLLATLFFLFPFLLFAQDYKPSKIKINWSKTFGGTNDDFGSAILRVENDYIIGGFTTDEKKENTKSQLFKIGVDGKKIWTQFYPDKKYSTKINLMTKSQDGNILTAQTISTTKTYKIRIMKVSASTGAIIWETDLKTKENVKPKGLVSNENGEIIVIYDKFEDIKTQSFKIGITKLDSKGGLLWEKGLQSENEEATYSMKATLDGFIILADETTINQEKTYYQLIKLNSNGKVLWRKRLNGVNFSNYNLNHLAVDSKGNIVVVGECIEGEVDLEAIFLFDKEGNKKFSHTEDISIISKEVHGVTFDKNDDILIVGASRYSLSFDKEGDLANSWDMWIEKLDSKGNYLWEKNYGGSYEDKAYSITTTPEGYLLILGFTTYKESQETDISIIELAEEASSSISNAPPKVWALIVGVSDYSDSQNKEGWRDLRYCHDDAKKIYDFLQSPAGGLLPSSQIKLLTNKQATQERVLDAASDLYKKASAQDLVVFYFSGHGGPNIFAGHDQNISHSDIKEIIVKSAAKKRLCIADACYSGSWTGKKVEKSRQLSSSEMNEKYYHFLGRSGDGLALFMSSSAKETSMELGELKQGIFTFYYIEGLSGRADKNLDKIITVSELFDYVRKKVGKKASHVGGSQHPQLKGIFDHDMPVGVTN